MLAHGADPNPADAPGITPVAAALGRGDPSIVSALRRAGARADREVEATCRASGIIEVETGYTAFAESNYYVKVSAHDTHTRPALLCQPTMPPRKPLTVAKLSNHGGQFILIIPKSQCI